MQMQMPPEAKPAFMGAIAGAVALAIVGFSWGGWLTASSADTLAKQFASKSVVAALAPICADNFKRGTDATSQLVELKKVTTWQQAAFVEKGGWAKMPGSTSVDSAMASACAEKILTAKP